MSGSEAKLKMMEELVADIRVAVGDPEGRLMHDELVAHCRALREQATALLEAMEPLVTGRGFMVSSVDVSRARIVYLKVKGGML